MDINIIYNEPCLDTISRFEDNSIDCVITSPPYWQLRDYGYEGQWGLEPTFQLYLEHLWVMMDAIKPKLKSTGTVWINLGDTYGGGSAGNRNGANGTVKQKNGVNFKSDTPDIIIPKCLLLLPHRFAIGCIDRGWIIRNDIIWAKRNGMPESVTDRFSKKHEYFFFMAKSEDYYFDLDVIKERTTTSDKSIRNRDLTKLNNTPGRTKMGGLKTNGYAFKNPGSVSDFWDIPTQSSKHSHYATYNQELLKYPVLAGCPKDGIVYDPFMGSGTTALMCLKNDRNFIGSEMSEEYLNIANKSISIMQKQTKLFAPTQPTAEQTQLF